MKERQRERDRERERERENLERKREKARELIPILSLELFYGVCSNSLFLNALKCSYSLLKYNNAELV